MIQYRKKIVEACGKAGKENAAMGKPDSMRSHRRSTQGMRIILKLLRRNLMGVNWIYLAEDSGQRRADVKWGTSLWV
jgi:hypothetical protein